MANFSPILGVANPRVILPTAIPNPIEYQFGFVEIKSIA